MTHDSTTTIAFTAFDFLCAAVSPRVAADAVAPLWSLDRVLLAETPWADAIRALAR